MVKLNEGKDLLAFEQANLVGKVNFKKESIPPVIDVVMPVYNEAGIIRFVVLDFYNEIAQKLPSRLIVAEDGSVDGTKEILLALKNEMPFSLFCGPQRKGYAKGVGDALRKCNEQWVFFSDADGQYFPSDFWRLWENRGSYDMIIGRKLHRSDGVYRTILANGFHTVANTLFGLELHDADCGFRLIRKEVIDSVVDEVKFLKYSFWAEFTIRACLKGFEISEVPIHHSSRANGKTQIYTPSKIPLIILKQLKGLLDLYGDASKGP
jgi:glycosyltransferase involved in cell wall biosynthesis